MTRRFLCIALTALLACGYHPVHGGPPAERFSVVLASTNVPDVAASDEVVAGVRDEFARLGVLHDGGSYPRCEIEVLRVDESSEGIRAAKNDDKVLLPVARATRVGVVARAWIIRSKDGPRERDTADMRASGTASVASDARTATFQQVDAVRAAGRRVGRALAARVLGLPVSSD
jgi:hypothetical protein